MRKTLFLLPGPAVTAATPTTPDNLATASAANTAVTCVHLQKINFNN